MKQAIYKRNINKSCSNRKNFLKLLKSFNKSFPKLCTFMRTSLANVS